MSLPAPSPSPSIRPVRRGAGRPRSSWFSDLSAPFILHVSEACSRCSQPLKASPRSQINHSEPN